MQNTTRLHQLYDDALYSYFANGPSLGPSWANSMYRVSKVQSAEANERALASGKGEVLLCVYPAGLAEIDQPGYLYRRQLYIAAR